MGTQIKPKEMLHVTAIRSSAPRKLVAGIEAGRPCNQNPSPSPTRFPFKLNFFLLSQTKFTNLLVEFHSNPLHTLNILPFARLSCYVSALFDWLGPFYLYPFVIIIIIIFMYIPSNVPIVCETFVYRKGVC